MLNLKNALLEKVLGLIWDALKSNPETRISALKWLIEHIPAIKDTATPEEILTAIKETIEASLAVEDLFQKPDDIQEPTG